MDVGDDRGTVDGVQSVQGEGDTTSLFGTGADSSLGAGDGVKQGEGGADSLVQTVGVVDSEGSRIEDGGNDILGKGIRENDSRRSSPASSASCSSQVVGSGKT